MLGNVKVGGEPNPMGTRENLSLKKRSPWVVTKSNVLPVYPPDRITGRGFFLPCGGHDFFQR